MENLYSVLSDHFEKNRLKYSFSIHAHPSNTALIRINQIERHKTEKKSYLNLWSVKNIMVYVLFKKKQVKTCLEIARLQLKETERRDEVKNV